jgi:hypothetical protein|tara:strand:+ start:23 stop:163 length:141 start_codon:yes stop_codon:yes gene_type:complete
MASARARLGAARRGIIGRQKKLNVFEGIVEYTRSKGKLFKKVLEQV